MSKRLMIVFAAAAVVAFGIIAVAQQKTAQRKKYNYSLGLTKEKSFAETKEERDALPKGDPKVDLGSYLAVKDGADLEALNLAFSSDQPDYARMVAWSDLNQEYTNARDGFAQQKIVSGLKSELEAKIQTWKKHPYFRFTFGERIPPVSAYSFETGGFSLAFAGMLYPQTRNATDRLSPLPRFGWVKDEGLFLLREDYVRESFHREFSGGIVEFSNPEKFNVYKAPDEASARQLDGLIRRNKLGKVMVYCFGQRSKYGHTNAQIIKILAYDKAGTLLFEM
jgi:hypothetical protein